MIRRKTTIRATALGLVFSGIFLWLALHRIDYVSTTSRLRQLDPRYLWAALAISSLNFAVRGWRWQRIFGEHARPPLSSAMQALLAGNAINNIVPGRAGDLARCFLVSHKVSLAAGNMALATLVIEKLFDVFMVLVIVLSACVFISPPHWVWRLCLLSFIALVAAIALVFVLRHRSEWLMSWVSGRLQRGRFHHFAEKIVRAGNAFADGLHIVTSASQIVTVSGMTLVIWATEALLVYELAQALGLVMSIGGAFTVCAIVGLGMMIPAAPGAVGTYEFFSISALKLLGMTAGNALALTLLLHGWVLLTTTAAGVIFGGTAVVFRQLRRENTSELESPTLP